jgi:hypothetical protein
MRADRRSALPVMLIALAASTPISSASAVPTPPTASVSASAAGSGFGADIRGVVQGNDKKITPTAVTRVNDCGTPPASGHIIRDFTEPCANATNQCAGYPQTSPTGQPLTILSTQIQNPKGTWIQGPVDCGAAAKPPGIDQAAIHDAFVKLVPNPTTS